MTKSYDWRKIVALKPKGYVEFQDYEEKIVYHGPLESVKYEYDRDTVWVKLKWVAQMGLPGNPDYGNWVRAPDNKKCFPIPNRVVPYVIEDTPEKGKRVLFNYYQIMYIDKIKGIDPDKVKDLRYVSEQPLG